jgi:hypothetical protein
MDQNFAPMPVASEFEDSEVVSNWERDQEHIATLVDEVEDKDALIAKLRAMLTPQQLAALKLSQDEINSSLPTPLRGNSLIEEKFDMGELVVPTEMLFD